MKETIAIIDDSEENLFMIRDMLQELEYQTQPYSDARKALPLLRENPPDLVLLDVLMPTMDGYEVCEIIRSTECLRHIPVIFVSGVHEPFEKVKAFRLGAVDYITKPFHFEEVEARIQNHLRLNQLQQQLASHARDLQIRVDEKIKEVSDSQMATIFALAKLSESRDEDTGHHMERIQIFCKMLATALMQSGPYQQEIDETFLSNIAWASALHDIGKVGISDVILCKPEKLTESEFDVMRSHTEIGASTLEAVQKEFPGNHFLQMGIEIARCHHEKWNGAGYPRQLKGKRIPLAARIMGLVDVYDALRSSRCYKKAFPHSKAVEIIRSEEGAHFDPVIVKAFLRLEKEFESKWDELSPDYDPVIPVPLSEKK